MEYVSDSFKLQTVDFGVHNLESVDYPDYADKVVNAILNQEATLGILCCGTGIGISIRAIVIKGFVLRWCMIQ